MTIFICSSFLEIHEIIYRINKKKLKNFKIVITTNKTSFDYFNKFFPSDKLIFLNSKLTQNPSNIISWLKELKILIKIYFWKFRHEVKYVYFNAPVFDLIAINLIFNSFKNSKIYILKNTIEQLQKEFSESSKKSKLCSIYSLFYNIPIVTYRSFLQEIYGDVFGISLESLNDRFQFIEKTPIKNLQNNRDYLLRYDDHNIKDSYIILSYPHSSQSRINNYDQMILNILLNNPEKKFYLKNHYSNNSFKNNKFNLTELNMNYPIELYNLHGCNGIICIFSSGLEKILNTNIKKICLYKLADFKSNEERAGWYAYINNRFDTSTFLIPESFEKLYNLID